MICYTKLKSGGWGIRVEGQTVSVGSTVSVRKKDGTSKVETVERVLWTGSGVSICAIRQQQRFSHTVDSNGGEYNRRNSHPRTGCSCGSREGMVQDTDCRQCRFDELDD